MLPSPTQGPTACNVHTCDQVRLAGWSSYRHKASRESENNNEEKVLIKGDKDEQRGATAGVSCAVPWRVELHQPQISRLHHLQQTAVNLSNNTTTQTLGQIDLLLRRRAQSIDQRESTEHSTSRRRSFWVLTACCIGDFLVRTHLLVKVLISESNDCAWPTTTASATHALLDQVARLHAQINRSPGNLRTTLPLATLPVQ